MNDWIIHAITIVALILGPILAVIVGNYNIAKRETRARRRQILGILMRHRRDKVSAEYVDALNVIETEFHDQKNVQTAYNRLMELYESLPDGQNARKRHKRNRDKAYVELVKAVAKSLRIRIDGLELYGSGYMQKGVARVIEQERKKNELMVAVLSGEKPLTVMLSKENTGGKDEKG